MNFDNNTRLWTVTIPFEPSFVNQTLECIITAHDRAGNSASTSSVVQPSTWWVADINNDNLVGMFDIAVIALNFGETG